jgi:nucleotide-binding universal stress UspA family protein
LKILIAYDGSDTAENALKDLAAAGLPDKAEAVLLTAIPPLLPLESLAPQGYAVQWYAGAYADAVDSLRKIESQARAKGILASDRLRKLFPGWKISVETRIEVPPRAILDRADAWKPDMILMGSHGWGLLKNLVMGSVAQTVLSHAQGNVRIGRTRKRAKAGAPRVLIAFDGSKESLNTVAAAARRRWPAGTEVKLLAVSDFQMRIDQITMAIEKVKTPKKVETGPWPWMEQRLAKAAATLAQPGVKVRTAILSGDPRHLLVSEAAKFRADTLFLGNRGLTGMKRFMLGSVSGYVASHAPCSVEIVRKPPKRK